MTIVAILLHTETDFVVLKFILLMVTLFHFDLLLIGQFYLMFDPCSIEKNSKIEKGCLIRMRHPFMMFMISILRIYGTITSLISE